MVEIYPSINNTATSQLHPQVNNNSIHGLLLNLGCLFIKNGCIYKKSDIKIWNSFIYEKENYEFILSGSGRNRIMCLHIKQDPLGNPVCLTQEQLRFLRKCGRYYSQKVQELDSMMGNFL